MERALASQGVGDGAEIVCRTTAGAPFGIETDEDIAEVAPLMARAVESGDGFDAFVIACYSDPGLDRCRAVTAKPVFGIHESAVRMAVAGGRRFGVLALSEVSIARHIDYVRHLGHGDSHAGERSLGVSVDEAANDPGVLTKIVAAGRMLVDDAGAEVLILGCAGLADHAAAAERELGVPVVDPVGAAVAMAIRGRTTLTV